MLVLVVAVPDCAVAAVLVPACYVAFPIHEILDQFPGTLTSLLSLSAVPYFDTLPLKFCTAGLARKFLDLKGASTNFLLPSLPHQQRDKPSWQHALLFAQYD